jgi:hypothetical protein
MPNYPYQGSGYDGYWKYQNPDPSTDIYSQRVAQEAIQALDEIIVRIRKRAAKIYDVRQEAIIVQDLVHAVLRLLPNIIIEHTKQIEKYEKENSGDISNFFGSISEEQDQDEEEEDEDTEAKGEEEDYDLE